MEPDDAVEFALEGDGATVAAPDLHLDRHRREVERAVAALTGVLAVRLVPGLERTVDEIHVVATPDRAPKQVVRDVQSLLYASFGISTDHRVISVVQVDENGRSFAGDARIQIAQVRTAHAGPEVEVEVDVTDGDHQHAGSASGPSSAAGRHRAVARATLDAVRPVLPEGKVVEIEGATVEDVLGRRVAIALVHLHGGAGERTVSGTAIVHDDEAAAVARSVLDALNRDLGSALD